MGEEYAPNEGQEHEMADDNDLHHDEEEALDNDAAFEVLKNLQAENAELNDRVLRLAAELENTRRRAEREKQDAGRYAISGFARDLLSVADNFERALASAPEGAEPSAETVQGLLTGVRMTEKELLKTLERHGVRKVDPVGERFDPNIHQAVAQAPAPGVPNGYVAQTAQPGFVLGERVLRAAMVIVSTGGDAPKTEETGADEASEPGANVDTRA